MNKVHVSQGNESYPPSALIKCQENFRFKVRRDNTFTLYIYIILNLLNSLGETPHVCLFFTMKLGAPMLVLMHLSVFMQTKCIL